MAATDRSMDVLATHFAPVDVGMRKQADGSIVLFSRHPLPTYPRQAGQWLRTWSAQAPDRVFLAERTGADGWETLTYSQTREMVDRLAAALLQRGLSPERPVAILSEKSLPHALLTLASMQVGIPVVPISPAYSLRPEAERRLLECLKIATPGLIYAECARRFERAIKHVAADCEVVVSAASRSVRTTLFSSLLESLDQAAVKAAYDAVDPDTPAKILFTSGSTGKPKAVLCTHRNLCSNQAAMTALLPFLTEQPPIVVDWQPWHHCGGANHNFHAVLGNGGSYYMDSGKPLDGAFGPTLRNLSEVAPTIHFGTPLSYDMLVSEMRRNPMLRNVFFSRLECIVYSGAAMPKPLWRALNECAASARGTFVPIISGYGMTEFSPLHTLSHWPNAAPDLIGVPIPGSEVKLTPVDRIWELRGRGPNLTPGYWKSPETTAASVDEQGFFRSGDAVELADPDDITKGLRLKGRLTEQFKLTSGTWAPAGKIRVDLVAACFPLVQDALILGEGRSEVGVLLIPNLAAVRDRFSAPEMDLADACRHPSLQAFVRQALASYNAEHPAGSRRIGRAMLIDDAPSLARGETTDKGYINQRAAIVNRQSLVDALYEDGEDPRVLCFPAADDSGLAETKSPASPSEREEA